MKILNLYIHCSFLFVLLEAEQFTNHDIPEFVYMNTSANPCQDFYEFTCGNFKNRFPLQLNQILIDQFTIIQDHLTRITNNLLELEPDSKAPVAWKKAQTAYKSCLNTPQIDSFPIPEQSIISEANGFPLIEPPNNQLDFNWNQIGNLIGSYGVPLIFSIQILPNPQNRSKSFIYLNKENPLNIPSMIREEYLNHETIIDQSMFFSTRSRYKAPFDVFLINITKKLNEAQLFPLDEKDWMRNLNEMADFIKEVYKGGVIEKDVNIPKIINRSEDTFTIEELQDWTDRVEDLLNIEFEMDWLGFFKEVFKYSKSEIEGSSEVGNVEGLEMVLYGLLNLVRLRKDSVVKNFALMRIFLYMAPDSDQETREAVLDYYRAIGQPTYERWEYCTRKIIDSTGPISTSYAVANAYQTYLYNINNLSQAKSIIENIQNSFKQTLETTTFSKAFPKTSMIQKLNNMLFLLSHPTLVQDQKELDKFYEQLRICSWDNYGNSKRLRAFKQAFHFSQLTRNRKSWDKSPFDVNAYNNRANNKITFPLAIWHPPFFSPNQTLLNYARIGQIVGHEMTHAFDNIGIKYDQNGEYQNTSWISQTDFEQRLDCFKKQYSQYDFGKGIVNGTTTLTENLADNVGLKQAYIAFKRIAAEEGIRVYEGSYKLDKLFFIAFGTGWCSNESEDYLNKIQSGSYPPKKWRVNGPVSNMEEFAEAFNCPKGSNMNPEVKCNLY